MSVAYSSVSSYTECLECPSATATHDESVVKLNVNELLHIDNKTVFHLGNVGKLWRLSLIAFQNYTLYMIIHWYVYIYITISV